MQKMKVVMGFGFSLGIGLAVGLQFQPQRIWAEGENPRQLSGPFVALSKKMVPSVVNIFTTMSLKQDGGYGSQQGGPMAPGGADLWRRFFEDFLGSEMGDPGHFGEGRPGGPLPGMPGGRAQSLGSGFVVEVDGETSWILTNHHVIDNADEIRVKFTESVDEKETKAEVVGKDADLDVALLKVKTKRTLAPLPLGDSDQLEQGEWIMAVGNPFGHGHSVTVGVVSAKERALPGSFAQYLQVDAPINPGNSGGPLANLRGEVVGINNAIQANAQGIGFAIPVNLVKTVWSQLKTKGRVDRGFIGLNIDDLRPGMLSALGFKGKAESVKGVVVTHVVKGGPADRAGLRAYDVVSSVNGRPVRTASELVATVTGLPIGERARIQFWRAGEEKEVTVDVQRRPDPKDPRGSPRGRKSKPKPQVPTGMDLESIDDEIRKDLGMPANFRGVIVSGIQYGSPADQAGLSRGDILLEVDRKPVITVEQVYQAINKPRKYLLRVKRQGDQGEDGYLMVTLDLSRTEAETE